MKKSQLLLLIISFLSSGRGSVLLNDSINICSESGGSHVLPGEDVNLFCNVDNTGTPGGNLLIWNTPVSQIGDLIHTSLALYQTNSIFSSTATFNGNVADSKLTFTTIQSLDNKVVTCRDSLGNSKSCTLLIYTVPSTIRNLTITSVTYQSISLSWNAPSDTGGYNTINYIITMTPLDGNNPRNITITDNSTSYIVTGLMFGQSYNFTARANNSLGLGEDSNLITTLIPGEVPRLIEDIEICFTISGGNYLLYIYWNCSNTVDANTPPVTNYTVNVIGSIIFFLDHCPSSDSPYRIQTFNNTQYSINITANNIVGPSIGSNVVIKNLVLITSDIELRGETFVLLKIRITWNNPCSNDKLQVIISYYKSSDLNYVSHNSSSSYYLAGDVSDKLFFIENLDPGTEYVYNISVYNGNELAIVEVNKTFFTNIKIATFLTITEIIKVTNSPQLVYLDTTSCTIPVAISVPITAIVTAVITGLLSSFIIYYCCIKFKREYSSSTRPETTNDVSSLEIKSNIAYGHVTIASRNTHSAAVNVVYDNVVI